MAVAWGQRKALGRKYSIDPALLMEQQRLENEYGLISGRETRATQAAQFAQSQAQQESQFGRNLSFNEAQAALNRQAQEDVAGATSRGALLGTGINTAGSAAMIRALTMEKGAPFFGIGTGTPAYEATQAKAAGTMRTVTPATTDASVTGMGAAGFSNAPAGAPAAVGPEWWTASQAGGAGTAAPAAGMTTPLTAYGGPAAGGFVAGSLSPRVSEFGKVATLGGMLGSGDETQKTAGGVLAGAAAGAAIGSVVPGVGTAIGAGVGAVAGILGVKIGGGK